MSSCNLQREFHCQYVNTKRTQLRATFPEVAIRYAKENTLLQTKFSQHGFSQRTPLSYTASKATDGATNWGKKVTNQSRYLAADIKALL
jgi:hypothetical protein